MKNVMRWVAFVAIASMLLLFTACGSNDVKDTGKGNTSLSEGSYSGTIGNTSVTLKGAYIVDGIDATIDGGTYKSASSDQVVFLVVNGGSLTIKNATINKTGDGTAYNSDYYNFYGINSAIVVIGKGSSAVVENCKITTNAEGANAVFAADNATIDGSDLTISTDGNSSRGLYATYGATITAQNVDITTQGAHCADLATDRGGGTVTVTGTNYLEANGEGSPCVYSTGEINVTGATGKSMESQTVVIEGKNSTSLKNCKLTSYGGDGIMLYQSMSGDAPDANATNTVSTLTLTDSTIIYQGTGPLLYVTNTVFAHNKTTTLISAAIGRWGSSGSNGGILTFNGDSLTLSGHVTADSISAITMNLKSGATLDGTTSGAVTVNK